MFKKMVSFVGKTTSEIVVAFKHGYNSVDHLDVIASIQGTKDDVQKTYDTATQEG